MKVPDSAGGAPLELALPHIRLAGQFYGPRHGVPVLALHGWLDNAASFSRLAPLLDDARILALDLPGHGLSGHRPAGGVYHLTDYLHDALLVADAMGWERFFLLGHSLGAILSALLAAACPERVLGLALVDGLLPPVAADREAPKRLAKALQQRREAQDRRKLYPSFQAAVKARMDGRMPVSEQAAQLLVERGLRRQGQGYVWRSDPALTLATALPMSLQQSVECIRAIRCPTRLILAEQGIRQRDERLEAFCRSLGIPLFILPGGHHLHLDSQAGAEAVAGCLRSLFAGGQPI